MKTTRQIRTLIVMRSVVVFIRAGHDWPGTSGRTDDAKVVRTPDNREVRL
jgi:hypothetical protein